MKKTEKNLYLLYMILGVAIVTANVLAAKIFHTGIWLFGSEITVTIGVISYPITFLVTDVLGEMWGKKHAKIAVKYGFICQLLSTALLIIGRYFPAVDPGVQEAYVTMLGQSWIFACAGLCGYLCSQTWDVIMFHKIRDAYVKKHGTTKGGKWIWNNASTMSSQLIDSILFAGIAFGLGYGWLFDSTMRLPLALMILGQWLIKVFIAALDTPLFYLLTRNSTAIIEEESFE